MDDDCLYGDHTSVLGKGRFGKATMRAERKGEPLGWSLCCWAFRENGALQLQKRFPFYRDPCADRA